MDPDVDYPCTFTLDPTVRCWHTECGVRSGQLPKVALFNMNFRRELYNNWLRFDLDQPEVRRQRARLYWALKKHWRQTGQFNLMACIWSEILGS